jgi:hypothetical protein
MLVNNNKWDFENQSCPINSIFYPIPSCSFSLEWQSLSHLMTRGLNNAKTLATSESTAAGHITHNTKIRGSNPAAVAGREKKVGANKF